jgi:hypothetical protein
MEQPYGTIFSALLIRQKSASGYFFVGRPSGRHVGLKPDLHKIIFSAGLIVATLLVTTDIQAASCPQYSFIHRTSFEQGDGEGMETHQCKEANFNKGDALLTKMQGMANAGQHQQARKELDRALAVNNDVEFNKFRIGEEICVRPAQKQSFESFMQQLGKKFAANAESTGKLDDAINIDVKYCLLDDAARLHLIQAEKQTGDTRSLKNAQAFSKLYTNKTFREKLLAIANHRGKELVERENRLFKTAAYNPMLFSQAIDVFETIDDTASKNRIAKLAEARGDELTAQSNCRILSSANEYYEIANQDKKIKALKEKALKIGADLEKQNNTSAAATCYELAGDDSRSEKMKQATAANSEKAEAAMQKNELARKAKFSKEQDDMEKELGL